MADWPEYDVPDEIGSDQATQDDTQGSATSTAPVDDAPQPSDTPAPAIDGATPEGGVAIPKYRFDELNAQLRAEREARGQERQMLERVMALLQQRQQQPPAQTAAEQRQLDEREQRIVGELDRLIQYSPTWRQLAPLLQNAGPLMEVLRSNEQRAVSEKEHWDRVATKTLDQVLVEGAKAWPGQTPDHSLDRDQQRWLRDAFTTYVQADRDRVARYEREDPSLVAQFIGEFRKRFGGVSPQARPGLAKQQAKGQQIRRLPTGGSATAPIGSPPPRQDNQDEDAVHSVGWKAFQDTLNASR